jgi:hypothetical protein
MPNKDYIISTLNLVPDDIENFNIVRKGETMNYPGAEPSNVYQTFAFTLVREAVYLLSVGYIFYI